MDVVSNALVALGCIGMVCEVDGPGAGTWEHRALGLLLALALSMVVVLATEWYHRYYGDGEG